MDMLAILVAVLYLGIAYGSSSYSSNGEWKKSEYSEVDCSEHYLCTSENLTWKDETNKKLIVFDVKNACDKLVDAGITSIDFHGDSYMRQIYAAMLITLNGNYRNGSIANTDFALSNGAKECTYHKQFAEKHCGVRSLNHAPHVCGGRIVLDPLLIGLSSVDKCNAKKGSIALISWGNYKVGPHPRQGVNNATAYEEFFEKDLCPSVRKGLKPEDSKHNCRVVWVSTHFRLIAHHADETEEYVKEYNERMREFFESKRCGEVDYVDVYNMTASLGGKHREQAEKMSYDQVHWGMEVNLVKAQIILNALVQGAS